MRSFNMNRMSWVAIAAVAAFVFASQRATAIPFTIDDFGGSLFVSDAAGGGPTTGTGGGGTILGGEHDITAETTNAGGLTDAISNFIGLGVYSHAQQNLTRGYSRIDWDGADASAIFDPTGLGSVDVTLTGANDRFTLFVIDSDHPSSIIFTVYSNAGADMGSATIGVPITPVPTLYSVLFTSFSGTIDFTDVSAIQLEIDGTAAAAESLDITIDLLRTDNPGDRPGVPEPATMSLLGLAGLAMLRRRSAKA